MLTALTLSSLFIPGAGFKPEAYEYLAWDSCDADAIAALPKAKSLNDCTICHFVQNKEPCINSAENIFNQRFELFGGKWIACPGVPNPKTGLYSCEEYNIKALTKLRIRYAAGGGKEYYRAGHYDFFQIKDPYDKSDPIVSGPNGELYCPSMDDTADLVKIQNLGSNQHDWGCTFDFDRGICYTPPPTTLTMLLSGWERSYREGNCGPICSATGRPWFPSKVLLAVCYAMEEKACCFPNQDTEIEEFFFDFLTAGDRCKEELIPAKKALRRIFCMACHHDAGKYIVDGEIRICKSLALRITPEKFDKCGFLRAEERGAPWFGDDMVTPSADFGVGLAGAIKMLEMEGGGDPQDGKLTKAAGEKPEEGGGPRVGAFPPFIPENYKIKIVDNCILDRYNPYSGEITECAEISTNITATCYDFYDNSVSTSFISLTVLVLTLIFTSAL